MKLWASPKWRKLTKKERKSEYWQGLAPQQRDLLRFMGAQLPDGETRESETERGREAKRWVEGWYDHHGCMTGDCPHETQAECDAQLKRDYENDRTTSA